MDIIQNSKGISLKFALPRDAELLKDIETAHIEVIIRAGERTVIKEGILSTADYTITTFLNPDNIGSGNIYYIIQCKISYADSSVLYSKADTVFIKKLYE